MNRKYALFGLALMTGYAHAGEFRGHLTYGLGRVTLEDGAGDELTYDTDNIGLSALYFLDDAGVFFGAGHAAGTISDFKFNDMSLGFPDTDLDSTSLTLGYRFAHMGESQMLVAVTHHRVKVDGESGDDENSFLIGVEQGNESARFDFGVSYTDADSADIFDLAGSGVFFIGKNLGILVSGAYSLGTETGLGAEVDVSGWSLATGVELRY